MWGARRGQLDALAPWRACAPEAAGAAGAQAGGDMASKKVVYVAMSPAIKRRQDRRVELDSAKAVVPTRKVSGLKDRCSGIIKASRRLFLPFPSPRPQCMALPPLAAPPLAGAALPVRPPPARPRPSSPPIFPPTSPPSPRA